MKKTDFELFEKIVTNYNWKLEDKYLIVTWIFVNINESTEALELEVKFELSEDKMKVMLADETWEVPKYIDDFCNIDNSRFIKMLKTLRVFYNGTVY